MSDNNDIDLTHHSNERNSGYTEAPLPFGDPLLPIDATKVVTLSVDHAITRLESLPTENLYQVISNLRFSDCVHLSAVSRIMRQAVLSFPELGSDLTRENFSFNTLQIARLHQRCIFGVRSIRVLEVYANAAVDERNIASTTVLEKMLNLLAVYRCTNIEKAIIALFRFYDGPFLRPLTSIASHSLKRLYLILDACPYRMEDALRTILTSLPNLAILSLMSDISASRANAIALLHDSMAIPNHDFTLRQPHKSLGYLRFECNFTTGPVSASIFQFLPNLRKLVFSGSINATYGDPVYPYLIRYCPKLKLIRRIQKYSRHALGVGVGNPSPDLVTVKYRDGTYSIVEPRLIPRPSVTHNVFTQGNVAATPSHIREFQLFGINDPINNFNMAHLLSHLSVSLIRMELEVSFSGSLIEMEAYQFPQLQELVVRYDSDQPDERLEPTLKWKDFFQTHMILQRSPNLRALRLEQIFVRNELFVTLAALRHLQSVELIQCPNIENTDHEIVNISNLVII